MTAEEKSARVKQRDLSKIIRPIFGVSVAAYVTWRLYNVLIVEAKYGPQVWTSLLIAGLIIGAVYSLIAIGYTLVYGILLMINFAHGDVMMFGTYAGYFVFEAAKAIKVPTIANPDLVFADAYPALSIIIAFMVGMGVAASIGFFLEKIAYRPLRKAPRLIPLISAIGASMVLQNISLLLFSPQLRNYNNPNAMARGEGWKVIINEVPVNVPYTGVFTLVLSVVLMLGLLYLVKNTRLGKSMRAVALDKNTAALMGINVNRTISSTFLISGALAGAAGVMWGLHNGQVYNTVGFIPGIKAFTAAVLGGIGNIPGAMLGGMFLGLVESIGPTALGISYQLKDVIAFAILIAILIFKPSGILGEVLAQEKV
jgi:branched-chain amino acid transport system permease protein